MYKVFFIKMCTKVSSNMLAYVVSLIIDGISTSSGAKCHFASGDQPCIVQVGQHTGHLVTNLGKAYVCGDMFRIIILAAITYRLRAGKGDVNAQVLLGRYMPDHQNAKHGTWLLSLTYRWTLVIPFTLSFHHFFDIILCVQQVFNIFQ